MWWCGLKRTQPQRLILLTGSPLAAYLYSCVDLTTNSHIHSQEYCTTHSTVYCIAYIVHLGLARNYRQNIRGWRSCTILYILHQWTLRIHRAHSKSILSVCVCVGGGRGGWCVVCGRPVYWWNNYIYVYMSGVQVHDKCVCSCMS